MKISLRETRPLLLGGEAFGVDAVLSVSPIEAGALLASGKARLEDPRDIKTIKAAEEAELLRVMTRVAPSHAPNPGSPWQVIPPR